MSTHGRDRIEVRPVANGAPLLPLWARKHYTRRVAANGRVEWSGEQYATRASAVRAARKAAGPERLWVHIIDDTGRIRRMIEPTRVQS